MIRVLVLTDFSSGYGRNLLRGIVRYSQQVGGWTFYRMPLSYRMLHGDKGVVEWAKNGAQTQSSRNSGMWISSC